MFWHVFIWNSYDNVMTLMTIINIFWITCDNVMTLQWQLCSFIPDPLIKLSLVEFLVHSCAKSYGFIMTEFCYGGFLLLLCKLCFSHDPMFFNEIVWVMLEHYLIARCGNVKKSHLNKRIAVQYGLLCRNFSCAGKKVTKCQS